MGGPKQDQFCHMEPLGQYTSRSVKVHPEPGPDGGDEAAKTVLQDQIQRNIAARARRKERRPTDECTDENEIRDQQLATTTRPHGPVMPEGDTIYWSHNSSWVLGDHPKVYSYGERHNHGLHDHQAHDDCDQSFCYNYHECEQFCCSHCCTLCRECQHYECLHCDQPFCTHCVLCCGFLDNCKCCELCKHVDYKCCELCMYCVCAPVYLLAALDCK